MIEKQRMGATLDLKFVYYAWSKLKFILNAVVLALQSQLSIATEGVSMGLLQG